MIKTNRLIKEKSPYLLQHSHNPVDWFPWNDEAFETAKKEDKPIFLSIGYSTCHWCHVMEKESFENEELAALMNDAFVSIKVDREERPDIDGVYMTVCQMFTGSGGWPLTIIMTPDKKPFFAGTYFPIDDRAGRSGMLTLIPRIKYLWKTKRDDILKSAEEIITALHSSSLIAPGKEPDEEIFHRTYKEFKKRYDPEFGGFGDAPKFPSPHNLIFLLRYWKRYNDNEALEMVENTITHMRLGGIYDQIGFGFHRYSTDRIWLVPHFEKMLYDQALLVNLYLETYQATGNTFYLNTAEEILTYVMRDMTSPDGAFYSAEDADSEGIEGKFYLWTIQEIIDSLDRNADFVLEYFNIKSDGNWTDPHGNEVPHSNILNMSKTFEKTSNELHLLPADVIEKFRLVREKLFERRKLRIHPFKDNKVLTDWNSLMISAFAKAGQITGNNNYITYAAKAAEFIINQLTDKGNNLHHRYRDGEAAIDANLDDYSFFIQALLDLYETTFRVEHLIRAKALIDECITKFHDEVNGGFFFSAIGNNDLILNPKDIYGGAIPSGNSIMMLNLFRMAKMTGALNYQEKGLKLARAFSDTIIKSPSAFTQALIGLDFSIGPSFEIVVSSVNYDSHTMQMIDEIRNIYLPNKVILLRTGSNNLERIAGFTSEQVPLMGEATVYICRNFACKLPVTDPEQLKNGLQ